MPGCNFTVFPEKIANGTKCQTIRKGKRFKVGDTIYCFQHSRTPKQKLLNKGKVTEVIDIHWKSYRDFLTGRKRGFFVTQPGIGLDGGKWFDDLAKRDGFSSILEMLQWFENKYDYDWDGQIIRWIPEKKKGEKR
jgi:hypothetical protein